MMCNFVRNSTVFTFVRQFWHLETSMTSDLITRPLHILHATSTDPHFPPRFSVVGHISHCRHRAILS